MKTKTWTIVIVVLVILALILFAGWATGFFNLQANADSSVRGALSSTENEGLPSESKAVVQLRDVSGADTSVVVLDEQVFQDPGRFPIAFELQYRAGAVDEGRAYSVIAQIIDADQYLIYATTETYPVITQGHLTEGVFVILQALDGQP